MKKLWILFLGILIASCQKPSSSTVSAEQMIIDTLEKETQYFCERNLSKWQEQWSKKSFVSKMYAGKTDFKEYTDWESINQNTVDHIREFPDPITIPKTSHTYEVEIFGESAFVFYSKAGKDGPIRETRFMVKEGDKWKIARMQTIY